MIGFPLIVEAALKFGLFTPALAALAVLGVTLRAIAQRSITPRWRGRPKLFENSCPPITMFQRVLKDATWIRMTAVK